MWGKSALFESLLTHERRQLDKDKIFLTASKLPW